MVSHRAFATLVCVASSLCVAVLAEGAPKPLPGEENKPMNIVPTLGKLKPDEGPQRVTDQVSNKEMPACMTFDSTCASMGGPGCFLGSMQMAGGRKCCVPACGGCSLGLADGTEIRGADLVEIKGSKGKGMFGCSLYQCADKGDGNVLAGRTCPRLGQKTPAQLSKIRIPLDLDIQILKQLGAKTCVYGVNLFAEGVNIRTSDGCGGLFVYHGIKKECTKKECLYGPSTFDKEAAPTPLKSLPGDEGALAKEKKLKAFDKWVKQKGEDIKASVKDGGEVSEKMSPACAENWQKFLQKLKFSGYFGAFSAGTKEFLKAYKLARTKFITEHCLCDAGDALPELTADGYLEPLCDGNLVISPANETLEPGVNLILMKKDPSNKMQKWKQTETFELVSQTNEKIMIGVTGACPAADAFKRGGKTAPLQMHAMPAAITGRQSVRFEFMKSGRIMSACNDLDYVISLDKDACVAGTVVLLSVRNEANDGQKFNLASPGANLGGGLDCDAQKAYNFGRQLKKKDLGVVPKNLPKLNAYHNPKKWATQHMKFCQINDKPGGFCEMCFSEKLGAGKKGKGSTGVLDANKEMATEEGEEGGDDDEEAGGAHKEGSSKKKLSLPKKRIASEEEAATKLKQKKLDAQKKLEGPPDTFPSHADECAEAKSGFPPNCVRLKGKAMDAAFLTAPEMFCTLDGQAFFKYPEDIRWINYHTKVVTRGSAHHDKSAGLFNHPGSMPIVPESDGTNNKPSGGLMGAMGGMLHRRRLLGHFFKKTEPGHPLMEKKFNDWGYYGMNSIGSAGKMAAGASMVAGGLMALSSGGGPPLPETVHQVDFAFRYQLSTEFQKALYGRTDGKVVCMQTAPTPEDSEATRHPLGPGGSNPGRLYFAGRIEGGCSVLASNQATALERPDDPPPAPKSGGMAGMAGMAAGMAGKMFHR